MLVNPFLCLSESHEVFDQDSLITPSFAPTTRPFNEESRLFEKESNILSHILPKTTNTVIIKNLNYRTNKMSLSDLLLSFGEISSLDFWNSKGLAIVTFYDSRSAERCIKEIDGTILDQRKIRCDLMFNQSSKFMKQYLEKCPNVILKPMIVKSDDEKQSVNEEDVNIYVSQKYGELRQIINCDKDTYVLEFYDFRNAQMLIRDNENIIISQMHFQASYAIEIMNTVNQIRNEQNILNKHINFLNNSFF